MFPLRKRKERGASQIEFILAIVVLFLVLFGVWELTMIVYTMNVLSDSAKEGVRFAIVRGGGGVSGVAAPGPQGPTCPCPAIENLVRDYARYSLHDITGMTVNVTYPDGNNAAPSRVRVEITYNFVPYTTLPYTPALHAAAEGRIVY